eukprot:3104173-Rhodomonas_salina.1
MRRFGKRRLRAGSRRGASRCAKRRDADAMHDAMYCASISRRIWVATHVQTRGMLVPCRRTERGYGRSRPYYEGALCFVLNGGFVVLGRYTQRSTEQG